MINTMTYRGMKCRRVGDSGLWVSEVGLGLWKWGDPSYDGSRVGDHEGFRILDRALELGVIHWDTACSYNNLSGNSERLIGRWFASRGSRERDTVVLATKISNPVRDEHETEREFTPNERGSNRKYLMMAVDGCLRRLRTDRIDILYLHQPSLMPDGSWETPLDETWAALDDIVSAGKARYLAVSNVNSAQLDEAITTLGGVGANISRRIVAVQNWYNIAERRKVASEGEDRLDGDERAFLRYVEKRRIGLVPFFPLASGLLTGRYRRGAIEKASGRILDDGDMWKKMFLTERNLALVENLLKIAERKGCSLAQLSIAWLLSHEVIPSVIAGVTRLEQLEENVGAPGVELTTEDLDEIERASGD
jgi:aryl-alcohol dehydrogenase-like predicted oxidoreductase